MEAKEGCIMKVYYKVGGGCVLCLCCVYECPAGAVSVKENVSAVIDKDRCLGCGRCYNECQAEAIIKIEEK